MAKLSITSVLKELSPTSWPGGAPPFVVARPRLKQMKMETHFPLFFRKLKGPRRPVRSVNFSRVSAKWLNDELIETHTPMLMYVLAGVADYCCGDYMIQIPAGNAIFIPAGVPRRTGAASLEDIENNPKRFCDNILFGERCGSLEIWLNHDRGNQHYRSGNNELLMINNTRLLRLLEEMGDEVKENRAHQEQIFKRLLEIFFWSLQRALEEKKAIQPGRLTHQHVISASEYAPIPTAQQYIREHLDENLTQDKVAQMARLSRTQFIRRFREESGQTFNQFVTACRLEQAKVLLQETEFTINYIGESVGFKSPGYLNRLFRQEMGMLPSEYRRSKRDHK
jgi:AraC-like DNA-binding protein